MIHSPREFTDDWRPDFVLRCAPDYAGQAIYVIPDSPMNLLMIGGDRAILRGMTGPYWHTLRYLRKEWDRIDVIVPKAPRAGSQQIDFSEPGGEVWFHPNPRGLWSQIGWIKKQGDKLLRERQYDLMTVHLYAPFYASKGALRMSRGNVPMLLELHGLPGVPKAVGLTDRIGAYLSRTAIPQAAAKAKAIRVVNSRLKGVLSDMRIPLNKIHIVPAIYLDQSEYEAPLPLERRTKDVVFCGRLDRNKGVLEVLKAVAAIPSLRAVIIGDGPFRAKCERFIEKHNLAERITLTGWLADHRQLIEKIRASQMLVMCSKYEGGPRVVFEALACGTVPIVTRVGLVPEVINNDENGVFTTGDVADLQAKISALGQDQARWRRLSAAGPGSVFPQFDRQNTLRGYANFLQQIAKTS